MSETVKPKGRLMSCLLGLFIGGLGGLLLGAAGAGLFAWALWEVETEAVLKPLADLEIQQDRLTADERKAYIDRLAKEYLDSGDNAGLVVGILKDGQQQVFGYGVVKRGQAQQPNGETVFEIGSVGKTFTGVVLADMQLKEELDWEMPAEELLDPKVELPDSGGREITLLDLATHSSGLPRLPENFTPKNDLNPYVDYTREHLYRDVGSAKLARRPGSEYSYSNLGFGLLGHLLAEKAGTTYEDLVVTRICTPLGMKSTRITLDDSMKSRLAVPHDGGQPVLVWDNPTLPGAGAFLSTGNDLLKYLEAHLADGSSDLHRAMRLATEKRRPTDRPCTAIGLGWHIDSENAIDIVWHNGGTGGSRSYVAFVPQSRVAVVALSNSCSSVDELGRKVLYLLHLH